MARTIDERVVEMRFDNAQFEKNVQTSLGTIDRLKAGLSGLTSKDLDFSKSSISSSGAFGSLAASVSSISDRFSAMGVVGKTVLEELTKAALNTGKQITNAIAEPLVEGGRRRALNIEQAKFQLKGLGVEWESIKGILDESVSGTAYGLDSAAKAASQMAASGIKIGKEMEYALGGISGVAAMTNREYEEIARIFTTVAGNGRLMGSELTRLGERGLNAAAAMAKAWGVTEEEIRKMASEKKITANDFFKVMYDNYFEHAKSANELYTGALANVKAAFSRIGADFQTPYLENMKNVYNALRPLVNKIRNVIAPKDEKDNEIIIGGIAKKWNDYTKQLADTTVALLENEKVHEIVIAHFRIAENVFDGIVSVLRVVKKSFANVFPRITLKQISEAVEKFEEFSKKLTLSEDHSKKLEKVLTALFTVVKKIGGYTKEAAIALSPLLDVAKRIADLLVDFALYLSDVILGERTLGEALRQDVPWFETLHEIMQKVADTIIHWIDVTKEALISGEIFETVSTKIHAAVDLIVDYVNKARTAISDFTDSLGIKDENGVISFALVLERVRDSLYIFMGSMMYLGQKLWDTLEPIRESIAIFLAETNPEDWVQYSKAAGFMLIAYGIAKFLKSIGKSVKDAVSLPGAISGLLKGIRYAMQQTMKVAMINSFTIAIATIAASLALLAAIPTGNLVKAVIVLGVLGGAYVFLMKKMYEMMQSDSFDDDALKRVKDSAFAAAAISIAMLGVVASIMSMAKFLSKDPDNIAYALGGLLIIFIGLAEVCAALWFLSNYVDNIDSPVKMAVLILALGVLMGAITHFFGKFMTADMDAVANAMMAMVGLAILLAGLMGTLYFMQDIDGKTLIGFALVLFSLRTVAKAIKMLGEMKSNELIQGSLAIAAMLGALFLFSLGMNKLAGGAPQGVDKLGKMLMLMAISLNLLVLPVYLLGSMKFEKMAQGLGTVTLLLMALGGVASFVKDGGWQAGLGMLLMAVGLNALLLPLIVLSKMDPEKIKQSIWAIGQIMLGVVAITFLFTQLGTEGLKGALILAAVGAALIVVGLGLGVVSIAAVVFGAALTAMVKVFEMLAKVVMEHFGEFSLLNLMLAAFGISLTALGIGMVAVGAGIAALGIGMLVLAGATLAFGLAVALGGLGLIGLSIGLEMMNIALRKIGGHAVHLFVVAAGLAALGLGAGTLAAGVLPLGVALTAFGIGAIAAAAGLGTLTIAVAVFGMIFPAMMRNFVIGFEMVRDMILSIVDFVLAALEKLVKHIPFYGDEWSKKIGDARKSILDLMKPADLTKYGPTVGDQLKEAFGGFGEKLRSIGGGGIDQLKEGMSEKLGDFDFDNMGEIISAKLGSLNIDSDGFSKVIGGALTSATGSVDTGGLKDMLGGAITGAVGQIDMSQVQDAMSGMFSSSFSEMQIPADGLNTNINDMIKNVDVSQGMGQLSDNMGTSFADMDMSGMSAGFENYMNNMMGDADPKAGINEMMTNIKEGVGSYDLSDSGGEIMDSIIGGIGGKTEEAEQAGKKVGDSVADGVSDEAVKRNTRTSGTTIANEAIKGIDSKTRAFEDAGKRSAQGYAKGLRNSSRVVRGAGSALVKNAKQAVDKTAKIHSPARLFAESGMFSGKGFARGLDKSQPIVNSSAEDMVKKAKESMGGGLGSFADLLSSDNVYQPTVRPVWDDTNIQNGMKNLDSPLVTNGSAWNMTQNLSLSINNNNVADAIRDQNTLLFDLGEAIRSMDLRLDTGQLVGGIAGRMDSALGTRAIRAGRGNHA